MKHSREQGAAGPGERAGYSSTAVRALLLLDVLVAEPAGLGLTAVATRARLNKATTLRLLGSLQRAELAVRDHASGLYRPGMKLVWMSSQILHGLDLRGVARPWVESLAREVGHAVLVGTLEGHDVVYIDIVPGRYDLRVHTDLGERRSVHVSSIGKAIVAYLPSREAEAVVAACGFEPHTDHTITDRDLFLAHLDEVRRRGWALVRDEDALGAASLSAPVFDRANRVAGAIGLGVPSLLLTDEVLERCVPLLLDACARASAGLGQASPAQAWAAAR